MARISCTSQRAALRRRKNLGPEHMLHHACVSRRRRCGERSAWGHQVPHCRPLAGEGGGCTGEKEPLISCLRGPSPAHC